MRVILVLLVLLSAACKSSTPPTLQEPLPTPVHASKPEVSDVPVYVEALGILHASALVDVRARLSGIVSHVHVKEGQWVEEGMHLFDVDSKAFSIKVEQAAAQVASAKARYVAAKKKEERFQTLADKNLISKNEWEQIETDCEQAKSQVDLDEARLKEAKLELDYCSICAQKAGRVGKVDIHPGHLVSPSQEAALAQIVSMDPVVVEFAVTENEFCQLSGEVKTVELSLLSAPEKTYQGHLSFTDNHFDATSGQILLRAHVPNQEYQLRPGMSVRVRIPVDVIKGAILVPQKAVKHNQFGAFVFVVDADNSVSLRQIQVLREFADALVVHSGLSADDVVITEGHQRAAVGAKVEIK